MARRRRGSQGGPQLEKQQRYAQLLAQGVSNAQACRIVGIDRRTGTRWKYGRTVLNTAGEPVHYQPVRIRDQKQRHARYLSEQERCTIADVRREGLGVRAIAIRLGRAPSTISRELRRNLGAHGRYSPAIADPYAVQRQARARTRRVSRDVVLHAAVVELLAQRWSPEQVAHELTLRFPGQARRQLCTESIYQAIYDPQVNITRPAVRRRRHRRRRLLGLERRGRIPNMAMISDRPTVIIERVQVGHWEGDCIMGAKNGSAIVTLVERVTRYLILVHLPGGVLLRRALTLAAREQREHERVAARLLPETHRPTTSHRRAPAPGCSRTQLPSRKSLGWARPAHLFATHLSQ